MATTDNGALVFDYQRAYSAANPHQPLPNIIYRSGWFYIDKRPYRRSEFVAMAERLWMRASGKSE